MTTAKQFLQQARIADCRINNKIAEVDALRAKLTSIGSQIGSAPVQTGGAGRPLEDLIAAIDSREQDLSAEIDRYVALCQMITAAIEGLPTLYYDLLHKRYIQGQTWEQVSEGMGRSVRWVYSAHGHALLALQKILPACIVLQGQPVLK